MTCHARTDTTRLTNLLWLQAIDHFHPRLSESSEWSSGYQQSPPVSCVRMTIIEIYLKFPRENIWIRLLIKRNDFAPFKLLCVLCLHLSGRMYVWAGCYHCVVPSMHAESMYWPDLQQSRPSAESSCATSDSRSKYVLAGTPPYISYNFLRLQSAVLFLERWVWLYGCNHVSVSLP